MHAVLAPVPPQPIENACVSTPRGASSSRAPLGASAFDWYAESNILVAAARCAADSDARSACRYSRGRSPPLALALALARGPPPWALRCLASKAAWPCETSAPSRSIWSAVKHVPDGSAHVSAPSPKHGNVLGSNAIMSHSMRAYTRRRRGRVPERGPLARRVSNCNDIGLLMK
jgi:hypothetical protein